MCGVALLCLLVVTGVASAQSTIDNTCPAALLGRVDVYYVQVWEDSCFFFGLTDLKTFKGASKFCQENGGTLAMPKTKSLNDFLSDKRVTYYGNRDPAWIGLDDKKNETEFRWADNSRVKWNNFAFLAGPSNNWVLRGVEDCVAQENDGSWQDYRCVDTLLSWSGWANPKKHYICQY